MTTINMWRSSLVSRVMRPQAGPAFVLSSMSLLTSARGSMTRMERVNAVIMMLNNREFIERCTREESLAMRLGVLISYSIDGPSSSLFRDAHSQTIRTIVKSFCGEAEARTVHLAWALCAMSRINTHIGDQVDGLAVRLMRRVEEESATVWYTEREIYIITQALSRFATQCYKEYARAFKEAALFNRVLGLIRRRYGGRRVVEEMYAASFVLLPPEDQVVLCVEGRKLGTRARSLILGCFCKAYSETRAPRDEDLATFALLVPHICQPEIISVAHTHISNSFAYSLGAYINAYQGSGRQQDAENVLQLARLLWEHVPPSRNIKDRSYATRLSLLAGVPWLKPTTEELRKAIAPLRHAYAFNMLPALRGLRVVASLDNAPRDELRDVIEHLINDNIHLVNLTDVRYVLRQLADPRIPVSSKVVEKVMSYVQNTNNFDADDLSMMARLVSNHAPAEYHEGLLKEVVRQFTNSVPSSSVLALSLIALYDVVLRSGLHNKLFFEKATEYNNLLRERGKCGEGPRIGNAMSDLSNFLYFAPNVLLQVQPLMGRMREVREFALSVMDLGIALTLNQTLITTGFARRILYFTGLIAVCGAPGRNVNGMMRPVLQHLMRHHVVTAATLAGFTRSLSMLYRKAGGQTEARRLFPVLNLYCTVMLRNQFLVQPVAASFAISIVLKRGSVTVEPVNRSHQETVRMCAAVMAMEQHRDQLHVMLRSGSSLWLSELLGSSYLLDPETRKVFLDAIVEIGVDKVFDSRCVNSLQWGINRGEFLYLS